MEFLTRLWGRFVRRPGLPSHLLAAVWLSLVVIASSNVEPDFVVFMGVALGALFLGGLWSLHAVAFFIHTATLRLKSPLRRTEVIAWCILPAIVVVASFTWKSRAPLRLRFYMSRPHLLAAVVSGQGSGTAGLFHYEHRDYDNGLPHLKTCTSGIFDEAGFVYSPDVHPDSDWALTYRHFHGSWYTYIWSE